MSSNLYPFLSKAQIKARILADDAFMLQCLAIMYSRQTEFEQEVRETRESNRRGFMSSHAVNGSKLAVKAAGDGLNEEERDRARSIVQCYSKQLACHFRQEAVAANPTLKAVAELFSAE